MVAPELKLTKKVTADKEGAGPHCQGLWLKEHRKLNPEDFTSCLRTLKLTVTLEVVRDTHCLYRIEKSPNHARMNSESGSERLLREH